MTRAAYANLDLKLRRSAAVKLPVLPQTIQGIFMHRTFMHRTSGSRLRLAYSLIGLLALVACRSGNPIAELEKPTPPGDVTELRAYGDKLLQLALEQHLSSGFSAAIVNAEGILWSRSLGTMRGTGA